MTERLSPAAVGFRAKTGRAIAIALVASPQGPRFAWRGEVSLTDPRLPATAAPYHEVMDLPWAESQTAVQPLIAAIEDVALAVVREIAAALREQHCALRAIGVVGSRPHNLASIGNSHIRAHAAEGILFRQVLERAAARHSLPCLGFSEDELKAAAKIDAQLQQIGRDAGRPWRADERLAAGAAYIALTSR